MKTKTLYILIAAAVLALIVAVIMNRASAPQSDVAQQAKPLLPGLKEHVNDVNGITLMGAGAKTLLTLRRDKDGWVIAEKSNYPVDMTKVREFLLKLSQATLLEQKTSNPKRYAELGVDDVKDNDAKGVLVDIAGLPQPSKLIIGNYNGGGGGTFVRRDGDAQSWLANENLTVAKNAGDWEKRDLADIAATRVRSVMLTSGDGKTTKVYKDQPGDANFKIADVPKGREASSEFAANNLGSVLANFRADDVAAAKDMPPSDKPNKAHYTTFDGVHVDATLWQKDNKDYGQFTASLDTDAANADIEKAQAKAKADYDMAVAAAKKSDNAKSADAKPAEAKSAESPKPLALSDPAKDRQEKLDALNDEVAALNKTFAGWTFTLPTFKYVDMTKSMDDLLKPLETKKPDAKDTKPAPKMPAKPASK
ncbi:MAG TPA: DUF4340 domain-containing protein [Rudaea sp.]|jgi:hypothetical protein|nr:DUF4340 domain-containing protein [Rudaea sp.]